MEFKKPIRQRPKIQGEPKPKKVDKLYLIPHAYVGGGVHIEYYLDLETAAQALQYGDPGIYKLVARAKFNKVVEDVENV